MCGRQVAAGVMRNSRAKDRCTCCRRLQPLDQPEVLSHKPLDSRALSTHPPPYTKCFAESPTAYNQCLYHTEKQLHPAQAARRQPHTHLLLLHAPRSHCMPLPPLRCVLLLAASCAAGLLLPWLLLLPCPAPPPAALCSQETQAQDQQQGNCKQAPEQLSDIGAAIPTCRQ
jgi:hypothetical protein